MSILQKLYKDLYKKYSVPYEISRKIFGYLKGDFKKFYEEAKFLKFLLSYKEYCDTRMKRKREMLDIKCKIRELGKKIIKNNKEMAAYTLKTTGSCNYGLANYYPNWRSVSYMCTTNNDPIFTKARKLIKKRSKLTKKIVDIENLLSISKKYKNQWKYETHKFRDIINIHLIMKYHNVCFGQYVKLKEDNIYSTKKLEIDGFHIFSKYIDGNAKLRNFEIDLLVLDGIISSYEQDNINYILKCYQYKKINNYLSFLRDIQ